MADGWQPVGIEVGPFVCVDVKAGHALFIESNITSVILKEGECFCMGEKLETNKKKYLKPFSTTAFFTVDQLCSLSFKTPLKYCIKPFDIKQLLDAFSSIIATIKSGLCPVTLICGKRPEEAAAVVKILLGMLQTEKIFPFCMDIDPKSSCMRLPGTVSGAPLAQERSDELMGLNSRITVREKETIAFLYGDDQITNMDFYNQLVENLTVRVASLIKRDINLNKNGVVINAPSSPNILKDIINITRPNIIISIGKGHDIITNMGPFKLYPLESIDMFMTSNFDYFGPSSCIVKDVDMREITIADENGTPVRHEALKSKMILGVIYEKESDPYLLKCFVCIISVKEGHVDLLYPSKAAADMKPKFFITTKINMK